jgi:hypothetical protein
MLLRYRTQYKLCTHQVGSVVFLALVLLTGLSLMALLSMQQARLALRMTHNAKQGFMLQTTAITLAARIEQSFAQEETISCVLPQQFTLRQFTQIVSVVWGSRLTCRGELESALYEYVLEEISHSAEKSVFRLTLLLENHQGLRSITQSYFSIASEEAEARRLSWAKIV